METVEKRIQKYRDVLHEADKIVEKAQDVPVGIFVQIIWTSGEVTRIRRVEIGSDALRVSGLFHALATEWSTKIISGEPG